jgi:AcrR family transcriptional regulator
MQMTATPRSKPTREQLLESALQVFHQQGVANTTLESIAQHSGVPKGNIFYHFKTKDDLVAAVIAARIAELELQFASTEGSPDPRQRLLGLIRSGERFQQSLTLYGCPYASLAQDLGKTQNQYAKDGHQLLQMYLDFAERQFRLLGQGTQARALAEHFIASLQGAYLLAHGTGSQALLVRQLAYLEDWIGQV